MGSTSDWDTMKEAAQMCKDFGVSYEARALSAYRTPKEPEAWLADMESCGAQAFIAGASAAAHLAGVVAASTILPVFGVPITSKYLKGMDSLLSTVQMPKGIPVATLALNDAGLKAKLLNFRKIQADKVRSATLPARPLASCVPAPVGRRLPIFREEDEIAPQWNHSLDSEFLSARAPLGSGFLSARSRFGVDGVPGIVSAHSRLVLLVLVGLLIRSGGRCSRLMYDNRAGRM